jgi:hypothetical protein
MNQGIRFCFLLLFTLSTQGFADGGSYWQCVTHDSANKQWTAQNNYKKVALNYSFSACKKQSNVPKTCKATPSNCEQFIQGVSIRRMWRCLALDREANPWHSDLYSQRYDAALAARAYCQQKSSVPDTCYVNLVTCSERNG